MGRDAARSRRTVKRSDAERDRRISEEIIVDAYGPEEQAMGWYCYLEDRLRFPFTATCVGKRQVSPLKLKDEVEVIGMSDARECGSEMFVLIHWERDGLAVPLSQLRPIEHADEDTIQAVEDWHYWVKMG